MTVRGTIAKIVQQEDLNFLLTNRIPRRLATRFLGWFSRIEQPLVRRGSIAAWRLFSDVDLSDARDAQFRSLHHGFTRALKDGARRPDPAPDVVASPCDAIVGACGRLEGDRLFQLKGFPYSLGELLGDPDIAAPYLNGRFVTLRLTAGMYHRFHAPHDCRVTRVTYISGDTWNVNPIALKRVEKLFCKNERALIETRVVPGGQPLLLVPVAAILVASIRLHFLDTAQALRVGGPRRIDCDVALAKGEEIGWFEHGSTIILFAPDGFMLCDDIAEGVHVRAGQRLLRLP